MNKFKKLKSLLKSRNIKKKWKWLQPKIKHMKFTKWKWLVSHPEGLIIGKRVDIGAFTYIDASQGVVIEADVMIGGGCHIYSHNTINNTKGSVFIGKGAKIGAHSVILPGTYILPGSFFKAGSLIR